MFSPPDKSAELMLISHLLLFYYFYDIFVFCNRSIKLPHCGPQTSLDPGTEYHLSLSRTVAVRYPQLETLVSGLRDNLEGVKRCGVPQDLPGTAFLHCLTNCLVMFSGKKRDAEQCQVVLYAKGPKL
jgi:hypothetical protein